MARMKRKLLTAQIKLVKLDNMEGIMDKEETFISQPIGPAREILIAMGYTKIREENEGRNITEIWELPQEKQTR